MVTKSIAPAGYCQCGCGQWVGFFTKTVRARGRIAGEPKRYVRGHNGRSQEPAYYEPKMCSECGHGIGRVNTTGLCQRCQMASVGRANARPKPACANCGAQCPAPGRTYCSRACYDAHHVVPSREAHWSWRGDKVGAWGARRRAQKSITADACEVCGKPNADRHHRDRNILNNAPENIAFLCRSCHTRLHYIEDGPKGAVAR